MKTTKMSLANIQGKLSRNEMKSIMAGSGAGRCKDRHTYCGEGSQQGTCEQNSNDKCVCNTGTQSWLSEECVA